MEPLTLRVPSSKSETHRALLLAARSARPCRVVAPLLGADNRSTLACLQQLGAQARLDGGDVQFTPARLRPSADALDCGNSGTTLRLLSGQVALLGGGSVLTGDASLQGRPNGPLLDALASLGASVRSEGGRAPLRITGPIGAGAVRLGPRVSSQYASALLLAMCLLPEGESRLHLEAPVSSRPYLAITRDVAATFGLTWTEEEGPSGLTMVVPGGQRPAAERVEVSGDWSGAAFPLVAAALLGRSVALRGLRPDSPQGDRAILDFLARFGLRHRWQGEVLVQMPAALQAPAAPIDLGATPDLFPALCALAARAPGRTALTGAPSLRHKESDRIAAMVSGLRVLGVSADEAPDGATIEGRGELAGGAVESHHDHRVYMAFRLLAPFTATPLVVRGAGCEAVSYPNFEAHFQQLRAAD